MAKISGNTNSKIPTQLKTDSTCKYFCEKYKIHVAAVIKTFITTGMDQEYQD